MVGNTEISDYVRSMCPRYFPALTDAKVTVNQVEFKEQSTYPLLKFDVFTKDQIQASMIVKFAPVFDGNNEGLTEYINMKLVQGYLRGSPDLGCVNPLEFISKYNALVTEFIPHKRLSSLVLKKCVYSIADNNEKKLNEQFFKSGIWLQKLHDATTEEKLNIGDIGYFSSVSHVINYLTDVNLLGNVIKDTTALLDELKSELSRIKVPIGRVHGDFGPQNIGVGSDGKVYVFDLQRQHGDAIYHDITYLLTTLETINPYPRYMRFKRSQAILLGDDFLSGYKENSNYADDWDDVAYHLYYLRNLLKRAQKQCKNQKISGSSSISSRAKKLVIQNTFTSKINRELNIIKNLI